MKRTTLNQLNTVDDIFGAVARNMVGGMDMLGNLSVASSGYPPYNIVKSDDTHYRIEIAVAGFGEDDLMINTADGQLTVEGKIIDRESDEDFVHRGVASRSFRNTWKLAEHVEVIDAKLDKGMLVISMEKVIPEHKKPKTIPIATGGKQMLTEG